MALIGDALVAGDVISTADLTASIQVLLARLWWSSRFYPVQWSASVQLSTEGWTLVTSGQSW